MIGNGISFTGLASGLDTQAIIQQLVALERIPIQQIEFQKTVAKEKLDLVAALSDLVKGLQEKAAALATTNAFFEFTTSVSQAGVVDVSASSGAAAGSHTIDVVFTAVTDRWVFDGVADPDVDLATAGGQTISFDVNGTSYAVTIADQAASSLNEIAGEIRDVAGADVMTSVVNVGTELNPSYQLVLTSKNSGEEFRISNLSSNVSGLTLTSPAENNITIGLNAVAVIDGLRIERSDNDFSDVIAGVSIDLLAAPEGEVTFTIDPDKEGIKAKIGEFVDAYNEVIDFINDQNTYSEESGAGGQLFGDSLLSSVKRQIQGALFNVDPAVVTADTEGYSTLALVGITRDNAGRLSVNDVVLDQKFNDNLELLADLFVDTDGFDNGGAAANTPGFYADLTLDSGLADKLNRVIDQMYDTFDGPINPSTGNPIGIKGIFGTKQDTLSESIDRYNDQIEAKERRLERFEENLIKRFAALEQLMGLLNAQGAAVSAALVSLSPGGN